MVIIWGKCENSYHIYTHKKSSLAWDGKNLLGNKFSIRVPLGFSIADDLRKMNIEIKESNSLSNDFRLLKSKRVEAIATLGLTGDVFMPSTKIVIKTL